jgi:hypothetical protein
MEAWNGFCGRITLVDDSLRSQWDGAFFDAAPFDPAGGRSFARRSKPSRPTTWRFNERRHGIEASS